MSTQPTAAPAKEKTSPAPLATMAKTAPISELIKTKKMDTQPDKPATPDERIDAIEAMLGHLIFMLEVEPNFTAEALVKWIAKCRQAERDKGIADPRQQLVFAQLCQKLGLDGADAPQETDPSAQQAVQTGSRTAQRKPAAG